MVEDKRQSLEAALVDPAPFRDSVLGELMKTGGWPAQQVRRAAMAGQTGTPINLCAFFTGWLLRKDVHAQAALTFTTGVLLLFSLLLYPHNQKVPHTTPCWCCRLQAARWSRSMMLAFLEPHGAVGGWAERDHGMATLEATQVGGCRTWVGVSSSVLGGAGAMCQSKNDCRGCTGTCWALEAAQMVMWVKNVQRSQVKVTKVV